MSTVIYHIDSFTSEPFAGNPAAVCLMDRMADEVWMQDVAREMNLSETAFVVPTDGGFAIRWFTPVVEVDLCGHATLASAHALWEEGIVPRGEDIVFSSKSGHLVARRVGDWIELDFPAWSYRSIELSPQLAEAIGEEPIEVFESDNIYFVELASEQTVRDYSPNIGAITLLPLDGLVVTAKGGSSGYDFVSRGFFPREAIPEDPVTGAIHCCLGPYWQEKLQKDSFVAYQASERGGTLKVSIRGDRIHLGGQAVTIFRGQLRL